MKPTRLSAGGGWDSRNEEILNRACWLSSIIWYLTEKAYSARWAARIVSIVTTGALGLCWASVGGGGGAAGAAGADGGSRWIETVAGFGLGGVNEPCSIFGDIGGLGS